MLVFLQCLPCTREMFYNYLHASSIQKNAELFFQVSLLLIHASHVSFHKTTDFSNIPGVYIHESCLLQWGSVPSILPAPLPASDDMGKPSWASSSGAVNFFKTSLVAVNFFLCVLAFLGTAANHLEPSLVDKVSNEEWVKKIQRKLNYF